MHTREQNGSKYPQKVKQQIKGRIIAIIVQEKEKAMRQAKVNSRKFIAVFTAVCMLLTFMPMSVAAAETEVTETAVNSPAFQDVTGHWGQTAIEKWSGYGFK